MQSLTHIFQVNYLSFHNSVLTVRKNPRLNVLQILLYIEFLIFLLQVFICTNKFSSELHKSFAVKQPLGLSYSLFLRHWETTLIEVTSMNLSQEQRSQRTVLPQDVSYHQANPENDRLSHLRQLQMHKTALALS